MNRPISIRLRRTLAAGTATLALVALAGCGGDDSPSTASDDTSASASTSPSTSPASDAGDPPQAGAKLSADEFGAIIKNALEQATTADVALQTGSVLSATGQVDFTTDPSSAQMHAEVPQVGDLDVVLVDDAVYVKSKLFGGGDKWVKLDLDDPNSPFGALGEQLDPASSLTKLVDGITSATYAGKEDVDGESLEHYTAVIDTKALLEGLPEAATGAAGLPATVDYQLWFDGDGLVRKFSVDLGTTGTSTGTFSDWGTKVDIAAPPAAEVTTMPGMGSSAS